MNINSKSFGFGKARVSFSITALFIFLNLLHAHASAVNLPPRIITGKVTDSATGQPLTSASIKVRGKKEATVTHADGSYAINAEDNDVLVFSYVGYKDVSVAAGTQTTIDVVMATVQTALKDVVVTALGITKQKRALGYSVSEVKGATLTEVRTNSFVNGLEGRVAGVNVSSVATGPNGASNVIIRGLTSLTGNNQPLYVLNGIPLVNNNYATTDVGGGYGGRDGGDGISDINPDDIENISILKGAAATALYGYRGANGVVLITTKKGKSGTGIGVELNSNFVVENVIDETDFQTKYGQGYNGAKPINADDAIGSMESSWGAELDGSVTPQFDGVSRPYSNVAEGNMARFYRAGLASTNTLSFSKGFGESGSTRFSASYLNDNSYVPNAGLTRFTFTQNTDLNLTKNLTLTLSAQYNSEYTKNAPNVSDAVGNLNWGPMFVPRNINITTLAGPNGNGTLSNHYELNPFSDVYTTNPYFAAYVFQAAIHRNRFIGSADLRYTFDNGFYISGSVNEDYTNDRNTNITPTGTAYELGGDMYEQNVKQTELNVDIDAGKKFKITPDLSLDATIGGNYRKSVSEFVTASGQNFATAFLYNIGNLQVLQEGYGLYNEEFQSIYAAADLNYKDYLYLTLTGRNDWYSTLAPGKINYLYPSVSSSFVYSHFIHILGLDFGKLRVSYANVGGEADGAYETLQTYGILGTLTIPRGAYPIGQAGSGLVPNSGLKPSKRQEFEIGTQDEFLKNRIHVDFSFYRKNVIDDILPVSIDYTSGYGSALLNVGNVRSDGYELELGGVPFKGNKFSWDISFNGTYIFSKVLSLGGQRRIQLGTTEGDWTENGNSVASVQQIVGKAPSQIITFAAVTDKDGNIIINPETGAPDIKGRKRVDLGSAFSPWTAGITNTLKYGNFDLTFLIDGKFGGFLFSNTNFTAYVQGLSKETISRDPNGYGTDKLTASDYYGRWANADPKMFVYDASFIKFRSLNFGYNFSSKLFHDKIQGIRLSLVCHNVFTIMSHIPNVDPETNYSSSIYSQGLESPDVPYSRTIGFNLNVKF